jgi:hypothetical protein
VTLYNSLHCPSSISTLSVLILSQLSYISDSNYKNHLNSLEMTSKIPTNDYLKAIEYRRTVYGLNDKSPVSDDRILEIIRTVSQTSPSSFNTQPGRIIVLLGAPHKKLWGIIAEIATPIIKEHAGEEAAAGMTGRFNMFKGQSNHLFHLFNDMLTTNSCIRQCKCQIRRLM